MGGVQDYGGGAFVDFAGFDAYQPVFYVVDAADAVLSAEGVEVLDEVDAADGFAVYGDGPAALEADFDVGRFVGGVGDGAGPEVGVLGGFLPGIFEFAGFDAAAPEVFVGGEAAGAGVDGQAAGLAVFDFVVAAHSPIADGGDDA